MGVTEKGRMHPTNQPFDFFCLTTEPWFTLFGGKEWGRARIDASDPHLIPYVIALGGKEQKTSSEGSTLSRRGKTTHEPKDTRTLNSTFNLKPLSMAHKREIYYGPLSMLIDKSMGGGFINSTLMAGGLGH